MKENLPKAHACSAFFIKQIIDEKGLDAVYDKIVDGMLKAVAKEIKND